MAQASRIFRPSAPDNCRCRSLPRHTMFVNDGRPGPSHRHQIRQTRALGEIRGFFGYYRSGKDLPKVVMHYSQEGVQLIGWKCIPKGSERTS